MKVRDEDSGARFGRLPESCFQCIDIDAAVTRGLYTPERLCTLASEADGGFDRQFFAQMLGMIGRFDDQDFIDYGLESAQVAVMRERFRVWQARLQSSSD